MIGGGSQSQIQHADDAGMDAGGSRGAYVTEGETSDSGLDHIVAHQAGILVLKHVTVIQKQAGVVTKPH